jgi:hypothetical protein
MGTTFLIDVKFMQKKWIVDELLFVMRGSARFNSSVILDTKLAVFCKE